MAIKIACAAASGPAFTDCHVLTTRFDPTAAYDEGKYEALIVQSKDGQLNGRRRGDYRDIWRSPNGTLFAVLDNEISWCPDAAAGANDWHSERASGAVWRTDGVGEDLVFAYGPSDRVHRLEGGRWVIDRAPGHLLRIHGLDDGLVFGVGQDGLIARWDGASWTTIETRTQGSFTDVFVASPDEMYAVHEGGLWEGTTGGWKQRLGTQSNDLLSVCVWQQRVWVSSRSLGLCTLDGTRLTTVKDNQMPQRMDARGHLLLVQHDKVVHTTTGEKYTALRLDKFESLWQQGPAPHWL